MLAQKQGWKVYASYYQNPMKGTEDCHWIPLDIRDENAVVNSITSVEPDVIIHTAYTMNLDILHEVIIDGTHNVVNATKSNVRLLYISTDVVFDGKKGWYQETDKVNPINEYGRAKAKAEVAVLEHIKSAVIVRTSLITGLKKQDPRTREIRENLQNQQPTKLFVDEYRCPIEVTNLATALLELAQLPYTGILHVAGAERLSRYEFGVALAEYFHLSTTSLIPCKSAESGMIRPLDCSLDITRAKNLLETKLKGIRELLRSEF
jgi:dTDP-4-dehydrorhamnose reductase